MNQDIFIYDLGDSITNSPRYIGLSRSPSKRLKGHIAERKRFSTHKNNWINKIISEGNAITMNIIDSVQEGEMEFWERWYICLYKGWGIELTNSTNGGEVSKRFSQDSINKIKEARGKQVFSKETREKMRERALERGFGRDKKGMKRSDQERLNISNGHKGIKPSEETRIKMSEWQRGDGNHQFGKKHTEEHKAKIAHSLKMTHKNKLR